MCLKLITSNFFLLQTSSTQVFIQGITNLNRAVHDDIVAIEILPQSEWTAPSSLVLEEKDEELEEEEQEQKVRFS